MDCEAVGDGLARPATDCEAVGDGLARPAFLKCEAPLSLFPLRGGVFLPIGDGQKGGGLPNGARAKHSLATIKQGRRSNFQKAKRRCRGSAERLLRPEG